jgi:general secretion pathway protein D
MRLGAAIVLILAGSLGCASSGAFRAGEKAERSREYDRAVLEYARALKLSPDNTHYQRSLERARLRASAEHAATARRLSARGLHKDATDEMRLAIDLQPGLPSLLQELDQMEALRHTGAPAPTMQEIKERARERSLPGLVLGPAAREPMGLSFRSTSLRDAYLALGKAAGVNFVFDPSFQDTTVSLDLAEVAFDQALSALAATGRTFHHVTDAQVVTVVPDTPTKRREYEQQVVKTFFLSNADLKETIDLLRIVLGARRVAPLPGSNALTISDTPDKVAAAERILEVLDKARAEVMVEIEILEVNRTRLKEYGIEITSAIAGVQGVAGAVFPDPTRTYTLDDNPYSKDSLVISQLPGVIYRLLKTDGSTRLLANPQLRSSEGQTAQARFGDQVPVPVTVFTPLSAGGVAQQPVTSFEYKSVGVNIDVTPRVHHDGDVSLVGRPPLPEQPDLPQPQRQQRPPAARRRDHHPGRPHPGRRARVGHRDPRALRPAGARPPVHPHAQGSDRDRHRDDADAARAAAAGHHRAGPTLVRGRGRGGAAAVRGAGRASGRAAAGAGGRAAARRAHPSAHADAGAGQPVSRWTR